MLVSTNKVLNFVNKKFLENFLSHCISFYRRALLFLFGPPNLDCLLNALLLVLVYTFKKVYKCSLWCSVLFIKVGSQEPFMANLRYETNK